MIENVAVQEKIDVPLVNKDDKKPFSPKLSTALLPITIFVSLLFSICFSNSDTPQVAFAIFCPIVFGAICYMLKKGEFIKNKAKLHYWFLAVTTLSLCNALFSYNSLTESNMVVMCLLMAVFTLSNVLIKPDEIYSLKIHKKISSLLLGSLSNWLNLSTAFKTLYAKKDIGTTFKATFAVWKIIKGILYAVPFFVVISFLLLNSDSVFYLLTHELFATLQDSIKNTNLFRQVILAIAAFIYFLGYIYNLTQIKDKPYTKISIKSADKTTSITFLTIINLLFLAFSIVQFAFLFTGGKVLLLDNINYSEYARQGFFELLFVTIINFSVILFFTRYLKTLKTSKTIKYLLVALCIFTGILIVSSFYRMNLYITAYAYTSLRLKVVTFLVMETILILGTIKYLFKQNFKLSKFFVITGFVFYLIVNFSSSDYATTMLNINRFENDKNAFIDLQIVGKDGAGLILDLYESEKFKNQEYLRATYTIYNHITGDVILHRQNTNGETKYNEQWLKKVAPTDNWQDWSLLASVAYDKKLQMYE